MLATRVPKVSRELFLAAVAGTLGHVEPWVMDRIAAMVDEEHLATGECLFRAGSSPDHFYFLREGGLRYVREGKPPETVTGPAPVGLLDALAERPRRHAAYALMPVDLVRVPLEGWLELLEDNFELARLSMLRIARDLADLEERVWARGRVVPRPAAFEVNARGRELDAVERMALLMKTLPVRGAWAQPISDLAQLCTEISRREGASLLDPASARGRILVIVEGRVHAWKGEPRVTWRGGPGEIVAGTAAFADRAAEWTAVAATNVRLLTLALDDWFDILEENFELVRGLLAGLAVKHDGLREAA
jgi:CRP-like cAMP-binding protein